MARLKLAVSMPRTIAADASKRLGSTGQVAVGSQTLAEQDQGVGVMTLEP